MIKKEPKLTNDIKSFENDVQKIGIDVQQDLVNSMYVHMLHP